MNKTIASLTNMTSHDSDRTLLGKIQRQLVDMSLTTGGVTIGSSSKKAVKIATTIYALIDGVLSAKTTAEVAFTATTHDVAAGKFAVFVLSLSTGGTVTITKSADAASLATVVIPATPAGNVVIGLVIVNPTGTGIFDATTTDLDDATVVPNAVYINVVGAFLPDNISL